MKLTRGLLLFGAMVVLKPLYAETNVSVSINTPGSTAPSGKKGPPPWAPAHGHRAKYQYRYFPGHDVYFEPRNGTYFYLEAGAWKVGVRLPDSIRINLNSYVEVGMNADKPYQFHNDIKSAYPHGSPDAPGKDANSAPGKGKGKGKKN
jgi:hypothetical protein